MPHNVSVLDLGEIHRLYLVEVELSKSLPNAINSINDIGVRSRLRTQLYELNKHIHYLESLIRDYSSNTNSSKRIVRQLSISHLYKDQKIGSLQKINRVKVGKNGATPILFAYRIPKSKNY